MPDLTIYLGNKNYSSWSLRPWLVLKQTTVAFNEVVIPLYQPTSRQQSMPIERHVRWMCRQRRWLGCRRLSRQPSSRP